MAFIQIALTESMDLYQCVSIKRNISNVFSVMLLSDNHFTHVKGHCWQKLWLCRLARL